MNQYELNKASEGDLQAIVAAATDQFGTVPSAAVSLLSGYVTLHLLHSSLEASDWP